MPERPDDREPRDGKTPDDDAADGSAPGGDESAVEDELTSPGQSNVIMLPPAEPVPSETGIDEPGAQNNVIMLWPANADDPRPEDDAGIHDSPTVSEVRDMASLDDDDLPTQSDAGGRVANIARDDAGGDEPDEPGDGLDDDSEADEPIEGEQTPTVSRHGRQRDRMVRRRRPPPTEVNLPDVSAVFAEMEAAESVDEAVFDAVRSGDELDADVSEAEVVLPPPDVIARVAAEADAEDLTQPPVELRGKDDFAAAAAASPVLRAIRDQLASTPVSDMDETVKDFGHTPFLADEVLPTPKEIETAQRQRAQAPQAPMSRAMPGPSSLSARIREIRAQALEERLVLDLQELGTRDETLPPPTIHLHPRATKKLATPPAPERHLPPLLRVNDLTVGWGERVILEHVTFDVWPGEILVILGGSGCGKSTLLKHLIRLFPPISGRVLLDGDDFAQLQGADLNRARRRIGVMFQNGALFGSMTLLENVRLPLEEYTALPSDALDMVARMKLGLVGLEPFRNFYPSEVSGGMQKRAAIARSMALDPRLLFLDEPSAGLDPVTSAELDQLIVSLSRNAGITFVIVTHELASIEAIADRAIMLDRTAKGVIAAGTVPELRRHTDARVRRFFNPRNDAPQPARKR